MQALIKEYGHSIVTAVAFFAIMALIFTGFNLMLSDERLTEELDSGIVRQESQTGEAALKQRLSIRSDNVAMSSDKYIGVHQNIYYEKSGGLINLKNGGARRIHINAVRLLHGNETYSDGYDVTDQVIYEDIYGNNSYLRFTMPGIYRIVVSVTDSNSVTSSYQVFVHVSHRKGRV
ncbi:MAG: hypothetical protein DUD27_03875 [Lachnospiraceae bacterium]|uniref:Uncharacterized protein n=1 Tax=Candidatus Weimeria bifida TaxID=2599074 RepID=A0A6N7J276_9FIRM|nr:hypothetical protein [Candidatus Weimeria bifida]RRF96486.1 MAG: hypothetical protein DUD27_03875 [Lachnospiraceae bacterium]